MPHSDGVLSKLANLWTGHRQASSQKLATLGPHLVPTYIRMLPATRSSRPGRASARTRRSPVGREQSASVPSIDVRAAQPPNRSRFAPLADLFFATYARELNAATTVSCGRRTRQELAS